MKRLTPKIQTSTTELFSVQRNLARLRAQVRVLEGIETELVEKLTPVYAATKAPQGMAEIDVLIAGMIYTVIYRHAERRIADMVKVGKVFASLGKRVPTKNISIDTLKVVKSA